MPLIGLMDEQRAARVLEAALGRATDTQVITRSTLQGGIAYVMRERPFMQGRT
jgi:hypothetical protein